MKKILTIIILTVLAVSCGGWHNSENTSEKRTQTVHNFILMDMSGSMSRLKQAAIDGANESIRSIKVAADSISGLNQRITIAVFRGSVRGRDFRYLVKDIPAGRAGMIAAEAYMPGGQTPLYDAIKRSVTMLDSVFKKGDAVLITIITDGRENASRRETAASVKKLIEERTRRGWEFSYLGTNQDAILEGGRIGISDSHYYKNTAEGYVGTMKDADRRRIERYRQYSKKQYK